jgi:hypothetical protein
MVWEDFQGVKRLVGSSTDRKEQEMTDSEFTSGAEDLDLEGTEADAVVGGRSTPQAQMQHLMREGYVEESCTTDGWVMYNPKTRKHKTIKA